MATAAVPTPLTENNGRTPSTAAATPNIMDLLSPYADTGASSGKENQQTVERGHEVNTPTRASVQQSAANNTTDSATSETDEVSIDAFISIVWLLLLIFFTNKIVLCAIV